MKKLIGAVLIILCLGATPAFSAGGKFGLAANVETMVPLGDFTKRYNVGIGFGLTPSYRVVKMLEVYVDLTFQIYSRDFSGYTSTRSGGTYHIFSIVPGVKLVFPAGKNINAFGLAGLGIYIQSISDLHITGSNYWSTTHWIGSEVNLGMVLGGGLEFALSNSLSLVPEVRINIVLVGTEGYVDNLSFISMRVGGKYRF